MHLLAVGQHGDIRPGTLHVGDTERYLVVPVRHVALQAVERRHLHEDAGIGIGDARRQQALGVERRGGRHHHQARHVAQLEEDLHRLADEARLDPRMVDLDDAVHGLGVRCAVPGDTTE